MASQHKRHQDETKDGDGSSSRKKTSHHPGKSNIPLFTRKMDKVLVDKKCECDINIRNYLNHNQGFLESYIMDNVNINQLQGWLIKKIRMSPINKPGFDENSFKKLSMNDFQKKDFEELLNMLKEETNEHSIVIKLTRLICMSIGVNAYKIYKLSDHDGSVQYFDSLPDQVLPTQLVQADLKNIEHVLRVAENGSCLRLVRDDNTTTFPEIPIMLLKAFDVEKAEEANHVLYQPLLRANWKTVYVIEMWRTTKKFEDKDKDISSNLIVWGSIILQYYNLYMDKKREGKMSDYMFEVVGDIFEEMMSPDEQIKKILKFAQKLVKADRASLFLVDQKVPELVSLFLDLNFVHGSGQKEDMEKGDVRMPINSEIVRRVALSGETMNIHNTCSDPIFNSDVDDYITINVLCMPVKVQGKVIAVVQMANKISNERFDNEDEIALKQFSTFFGLALHQSRLYDEIEKNENKFKVALEMIIDRNTCKEHDVKLFSENNQYTNINVDSLNNFYLDPYELNDIQKCKAVITMFYDLFEPTKFDNAILTRFILTVKMIYRPVPYHNFSHGWSVAHAMYVIIKRDYKKCLDDTTRLALFVSSLCHDLDHRGYTANYLNEISSPLAAMYTSSILEHHHFNNTSIILQLDGHNLFSNLTTQEYKETLGCIKKCILATDLAAFFPNKQKLEEIHNMNSQLPSFDWAIPNHRELGMAISMTAADLSASAKPWDIQLKTVKVIFEEFYDQGDNEKKAGKTPIAMMDRNKKKEQPASQVDFLSKISIPCYKILYKILPETMPLYHMARENLNSWESKLKSISDNSGRDEFSSEDSLKLLPDSKGNKDAVLEKSDSHLENIQDIAVGISRELDEFRNDDDDTKIKGICSKIMDGLKCIKSHSGSLEEDQESKVNVEAKEIEIWKDEEGNLVDDEGVMTRSNKALM